MAIDVKYILDGSHCENCEVYLGKAKGFLRWCYMCEKSIDPQAYRKKIIELRREDKKSLTR